METLISIDPGMSTGIAIGSFSEEQPYELTHVYQLKGGVYGFNASFEFDLETNDYYNTYGSTYVGVRKNKPVVESYGEWFTDEELDMNLTIIAEKFTARGTANNFTYRTEALEPLRVEGALLAKGVEPVWVSPAQQYFAGGDSKSPVTNAHRWLKEKGLHVTGKDVGCKDANDARSAILHSIAWLKRRNHRPTLEKYFKE